jgi:hypothetical protein
MRKRYAVLSVVAAALLLLSAAGPLAAQGPEDRRPLQLYVDLGYVNLFSYPKWINIGPELEVRLGRFFSLNPDVSLWIGQSFGRKVKVVPGLTANVRLGRFVVGGGAVHRVSDWPESGADVLVDRGWIMPKAQIAYAMGPARLTFSLLFPGGVDKVAAGLTIGMSLGRQSRD